MGGGVGGRFTVEKDPTNPRCPVGRNTFEALRQLELRAVRMTDSGQFRREMEVWDLVDRKYDAPEFLGEEFAAEL